MKKIVYCVLACIIIIGGIIILTMGLNVDIIYSKNVEINVYIGKAVNIDEIEDIAKQVFPNERMIVRKIELFDDMISITIPEKSDEDLKEPVEQLNSKINEKYELENKSDSIDIVHNSKIRLYSIMKPYIMPIVISLVIIIVYVAIRYKKLGILKVISNYVLNIIGIEAVFLSVLAITRMPINRLVIPIGLLLYIITITVLGFNYEKKLVKEVQVDNTKK